MDAAASTATMATPVVVTVGNPNTGKSTLFNQLTGLRQKVSNYPGVTVEQVSGHCDLGGIAVRLVDVPGTYSLAAMSPDEIVTVDVLRGAVAKLELEAERIEQDALAAALPPATPNSASPRAVAAANLETYLAARGVAADRAVQADIARLIDASWPV